MAIRITEDGVVNYENSPDVNRKLFPNLNICGKEIAELEEEINGKAPAVYSTTSGSIASFADGADDLPLKSCVVNIEPIQEGSGDPSPDNVRSISGRTGLSVVRSGKNLLDTSTVSSGKGLTITKNADGSIHLTGTPTGTWIDFNSAYNVYIPAGSYILSLQSEIPCNFVLYSYYVGNTNRITNVITNGQKLKVVSFESNVDRIWVGLTALNTSTAYDFTIYPQLELGSTATDYEPYQGETVSVNWETEAGTVYGGYVDIVSGKLTVDRANISSYDGETLPSTWISDRDVYVEGTTPTTGAQVVYQLAEPIEYQLSTQDISTLLGDNNIWSDAGDTAVEYPADTKTYIGAFSIKTVEVTGQTPTITAEENTRYICGEVTSLSFTPCDKGICDVRFTAASISTVLTLPETVKLPAWFDPTLLEAGTTYEINVLDGIYGVVMSWA